MKTDFISGRVMPAKWTLALWGVLFFAQAGPAEILPPERLYAWRGNVGIPGGIPNVTSVYTNLQPSGGDDTLAIRSALDRCPSNRVVKLGPGTFVLSGTLDYASVSSGVVLRGSGPNNTILRFIDASVAPILMRGTYSDTSIGVGVDLAATAVKGSTSVSLSSVPSWVKLNHLYVIDQVDDPSFVTAGTTAIWETGNDFRYQTATTAYGHRGMSQLVKVIAINGTTITTEMPLVYGFGTGQAARFWKSIYDPVTTSPLRRCGIEDLKVVSVFVDAGAHQIKMESCDNCWLKNVESDTTPGLAHVFTVYSYRCEIRDSYFHGGQLFGPGQGYGVALYNGSTGFLVENNVCKKLHASLQVNFGSCGNVFGYNAVFEGQDDGSNKSIVSVSAHGSHAHNNLIEGNFAANQINFDVVHGSGSHNVIFRNRIMGTNNINDGESCINLEYYNRRCSAIGNILGSSEHSIYERVAPDSCSSSGDKIIWKIGHRNSYGCSSGCVPGGNCYDTLAANGVLRAVNYDTVTRTNNGIVLGGFTTNDLVNSYYLSSKPAWFGDRPWPPFSPSSPTIAVATNLPAGYRHIFGVPPPPDGNRPPIVVATGSPTTGGPPLVVGFSSAGSSDPEGLTLSYSWNFGDGTIATTANPTHTYQTAGSYTAILTVSDGVNTAFATGLSIQVGNQPPIAAANANPSSGTMPLVVTLSSSGSSDPEGVALSYIWSFGDGTPSSTAANPSHTYQTVGTYVASLTVSDGQTSASNTVTINVKDPSSNLVAAYGFEEASGTIATDASGNGNSGAIIGGIWITGKFGSALLFNGTNTMVSVNDSASLDITTALTLEAWVKPTSLGNPGGWKDIIFKSADIYFLMAVSPQAQAPQLGGMFGSLYGTSALPLNTWTHLAGTYDGATLRLYVNGTQVASVAQTGGIPASTGALSIGGDSLNSQQFFAGVIDEVRIYNRALNATEIQSDMNTAIRKKPAPPTNLRLLSQSQ